jgi:hypothetical protein
MPKYQFSRWEESKYIVTFTADNLEDAKKQMEDASSVDDLQDYEEFWKKGNDEWDKESLEEIEGDDE